MSTIQRGALSERQRRFAEYLFMNKGKDATQAARDAGYTGKHVAKTAYELRRQPKVIDYMEELAVREKENPFSIYYGDTVAILKAIKRHPDARPEDVLEAIKVLISITGYDKYDDEGDHFDDGNLAVADEPTKEDVESIQVKMAKRPKRASKEVKLQIREELSRKNRLDRFMTDFHEWTIEDFIHEMTVSKDATFKEVTQQLAEQDFRVLFNMEAFPRYERRACMLISGNRAWFERDMATGIYHYFTKYPKGPTFSLDLFDMMEVLYGFSVNRSVRYLCEHLDIDHAEREFMMSQTGKLMSNEMTIDDAIKGTHFKKWDPELYQYIRKSLPTLRKLMDISDNHVVGRECSIEGESLFFTSTADVADYAPEIERSSQSKVSRAINVLAVLGFIDKHEAKDVPAEMLERARRSSGPEGTHNLVNFYTIKYIYQETLDEALRRVQLLNEQGVRWYELNNQKTAEVFGEYFASGIFIGPRTSPLVLDDSEFDDLPF